MRIAIAAASFVCFAALLHAETVPDKPKLWASITVTQPVFRDAGAKRLQIYFAVVNDGKTTVDPKVEMSHLFINGTELKDWSFIVGNGPRSSGYQALQPGHALEFAYALGDRFQTPGVYKVRWQGDDFQAPEITFRVLPKSQP